VGWRAYTHKLGARVAAVMSRNGEGLMPNPHGIQHTYARTALDDLNG